MLNKLSDQENILKILVTPTSFKPDKPTHALKLLKDFADELVFNPVNRPLNGDELIPLLRGCDGYIAGVDFITAETLAACDRLKVISRYGVGIDRVDLAAAKARGITVCNTPGANAQAVADLAMGLILSVARRIPMLDRSTRDGLWIRSTGVEIYGKTIGILGLGVIGKSVAKRAQGFSMRVMAYDPYMDDKYAQENDIIAADFDTLIKSADIISLHLPLTQETRHIIGGDAMRSMKPGVIIVNTARGGLIDEAAAVDLLKSGHIGGLGLDVYEQEPPEHSALCGLDNVVLTPHTAPHTAESTRNMADMSVRNLIDILSGSACPYIVV